MWYDKPALTKGVKVAKGENSNPFFSKPQIKKPLISPQASLNKITLKKTSIYDLPTKPGKVYILEAAKN